MANEEQERFGVAEIILKQIKSIDFWALGSWGAREYVKDDKSITFRVNGSRLRGKIEIVLNPSDLYDITAWKIYRGIPKPIKTIRGIYFDQLVIAIDSLVG